jgi:glycosyltransferase involved in cell wall biosynthesis
LGVKTAHTNTLECLTACKIFDELGYNVDVVDYDSRAILINYNQYDLIYGFGTPVEESFNAFNGLKRVIYGTGCDTVYSNTASLARVKVFYAKHEMLCLNSARLAELTWRRQLVFADLVISLGNSFVKKTYQEQTNSRVESLNLFFRDGDKIDLFSKNYSLAKKKFIWWGSAGAIHKGLDLLLEVFSKRKDIELYVCGYKPEYPFHDYFLRVIAENDNIHDLGFVTINSTQYFHLLSECAATVYPSVSEGGAAGIIQLSCVGGIIPIVSKNVGLDIPFPDLNITNLDPCAIESAIDVFLGYGNDYIKAESIRFRDMMVELHSYENYVHRLRNLISEVIFES